MKTIKMERKNKQHLKSSMFSFSLFKLKTLPCVKWIHFYVLSLYLQFYKGNLILNKGKEEYEEKDNIFAFSFLNYNFHMD